MGRSDQVYQREKKFTSDKRSNNVQRGIESKDGELLTDSHNIKKRWKEYTEMLYNKDGRSADLFVEEESEVDKYGIGPDIMRADVLKAIEELKKEGRRNRQYSVGNVKGIKGHYYAQDSVKKIGEQNKTDAIGQDQFGFIKGRGREAIAVMRILADRSIEHDQEVYVSFVDFEKAFDRVNWEKLLEILKTDSEKGLQEIMDSLNAVVEDFGMRVNIKKTKVMRINKNGEGDVTIKLNGKNLEQVKSFQYLESILTSNGYCSTEIRLRIALAKVAFNSRRELLTKKFNLRLKKRMIKTLVCSVLLYGSESWTLKTEDIRRLESADMWFWRRLEKISWTEKVTNEEVLLRIGEKRTLISIIYNRQKKWIGHVMRHQGLLRDVIEGRLHGKRCKPQRGQNKTTRPTQKDCLTRI
ncbi:uncharacterized protein LOC125034639 [Penaeus chinensis]|uniref:uncharacterized protein LOC125034639 n=1 Tax=Penaeus chinensis TaxID=139456 RepID=UPI001FB63C4B|nr:uncharacterized protein LOC125034639 [Penaeus chinensis]